MPPVSDCLFCRIVTKEIPAKIVHEDEHVLAFRDIAPQAPTHLLVIPKRHVANVAAAEDDAALLGRVMAAAGRLAREGDLTDYRIVSNNGAGAGQSVFHLHVHLLSGRPFTWPPG